MTTRHSTHPRRAPAWAAGAGTAALLLAACSPSEPAPPTLEEALDAADALLSEQEGLEDVLVEPRPGRGPAEFTFMATQSARSIIRCLTDGEMTVRIHGEERFSDTCGDATLVLGAYGVDIDHSITRTLAESVVQVEAADDVYWVAALYTHSIGGNG